MSGNIRTIQSPVRDPSGGQQAETDTQELHIQIHPPESANVTAIQSPAFSQCLARDIDDLDGYVSPKDALKHIEKGRATGNRAALWIRSVIQSNFFILGKFVQRHAGIFLMGGLIILAIFCLGLQKIQLETRLEKLWIEEGGRVESEQRYIQQIHGSETGATSQILLQTPSALHPSILTPDALLFHLKMALLATEVEVHLFKTNWALHDICHKISFPNFDETSPVLSEALERLTPCSIISPLDCFWEGAKLLGPADSVLVPGYGAATWETLDLQKLQDGLKVNENDSLINTRPLLDFLQKADVRKGYVGKPCLDPHDVECPDTSPNKRSETAPDVEEVMTNGCYGLSAKYMHWHPDLLMGNIIYNKSYHIQSASAIQTIFHISDAKTLYETFRHHAKTWDNNDGAEWTEETAAKVISAWQSKFRIEVERTLRGSPAKGSITVFAESMLAPVLAEFSKVNILRTVVAYGLMVAFVAIVSRNWSDPVNSCSGLGIAGSLLATVTVAAGLGICSFMGVSLNALSTQVVPFVALGLNIQHIMQMIQTIPKAVKGGVPTKDVAAECLKLNGCSVLFTSLTMSSAFFAGYAIPLPALRVFSIQMGIITLLGCPCLLFLFPALISIDQRRRSGGRLDLFCCYGRATNNTVIRYTAPRGNLIQNNFQESVKAPCSRGCVFARGRGIGRQYSCRCQTGCRSADISGSTYSIFRLDPPSCCLNLHTLFAGSFLPNCLVNLYLGIITSSCAKFLAAVTFCIMLGYSAWGVHRIEDGLDITEFIPKDAMEHRYFDASSKNFPIHNVFIVTKGGFDYQHSQKELLDFHQTLSRVKGAVNSEGADSFWLVSFRDWLKEIDAAFSKHYYNGCFGEGFWYHNASDDAILGYKLRAQTGKSERPVDYSQIANVRLVDEKGIINPKGFYNYLSAWAANDPMAYSASQALLHPDPKHWLHDPADTQMVVPKSLPLEFAQIPIVLSGLDTSSRILSVVKQMRAISQAFEERGIFSFPTGTLFSYWEQYINLRFNMVLALLLFLGAVFIVISVILMSPWSAVVVIMMTAVLLLETAGLVGWLHIKLNAILAVIIIYTTGIGVQISFPICSEFLTGIGGKDRRVQYAMHRSTAPILHGIFASVIGIVILASSEFDFIFKYFFLVLAAVSVLTILNSLIFLPMILALLGPVADLVPVDDPEHLPATTPEPPSRPESHSRLSRRWNKVAISTASLSTISEEDSISCQQIFLEPQVIVETTTSFPSHDQKNSCTVPEGLPTTSVTTTVSTRAKLMVEVHRPGSFVTSDSSRETPP